jgi:hypothetical protein
MRSRHVRQILSLALVATAAVAVSFAPRSDSDLTVHEWGTFTTVAGTDGRAIEWLPLSGPTDLPCFVHHYQNNSIVKVAFSSVAPVNRPLATVGATTVPGAATPQPVPPAASSVAPWQSSYQGLSYEQSRANLWAKVRMETPVLYFYAPEQTIVDVLVQFPRGLMTEWYPQATVTQSAVTTATLRDPHRQSLIRWQSVTIMPSANPTLPGDGAKSHYYAARETDAAVLDVAGQKEKFLFYRGVADFDVPLSAEVLQNGSVRIRNLGTAPLPAVILFENRAGRIGYRMLGSVKAETIARAPSLGADFDALRRDLVQLLVSSGLFRKEATAMVDTWRDSWFEEGTRVFYVMPPSAVESVLPLRVAPAPSSVARVFVGRMDVITPAMEHAVESALTSDSDDVIERFGRLLDPITDRIVARTSDRELLDAIAAVKKEAFTRYTTALTTCR